LLLRFRIGSQEISRRHGVDHLLDREPDFLLVAGRRFDGVGHCGQELGIEQIGCSAEGRHGIVLPVRGREPLVVEDRQVAEHGALPQFRGFFEVIVAQFFQRRRRDRRTVFQQAGQRIGLRRWRRQPCLPCARVRHLRHPCCGDGLGIRHVHIGVHWLKLREWLSK
jgi:hypothetical protein